ncbi:Protein LURP-one-related 8 [Triticum urartu]|uniref:Protein LURP-one-related 8 n=2 Tax=Triticum urartu TaxID=4572 RepID=M7ZDW5_TRIUA|nr:Protein LURP-one-related 8 [Triticum urartu]
MAKVHPNLAVPSLGMAAAAAAEPVTLTVWRKSLLFNCRGFTVFDASGNLVYRVDIYASDSRAEVVLMDAAGRPVLTVRRKKAISLMGDQWLVFPGEARWTRCSGGRGCSGAGPRSAAETGSPPSNMSLTYGNKGFIICFQELRCKILLVLLPQHAEYGVGERSWGCDRMKKNMVSKMYAYSI